MDFGSTAWTFRAYETSTSTRSRFSVWVVMILRIVVEDRAVGLVFTASFGRASKTDRLLITIEGGPKRSSVCVSSVGIIHAIIFLKIYLMNK